MLQTNRFFAGLISVDIQSHWTWSSTLLQSANQAFQYVSIVAGGKPDVCTLSCVCALYAACALCISLA